MHSVGLSWEKDACSHQEIFKLGILTDTLLSAAPDPVLIMPEGGFDTL
uniref:Uncharacterized protein n=1 Tax=viral metagenome TaxID=1070528 RepID=A0A6C0CMD6_9ZZZZ